MEFAGKPVPVDWDSVEKWLGVSLPADYKAIASEHGPLDIGEFVWLHVPCVQAGSFDWGAWVKQTRSVADAPRHLVPWGATRGGGYLFWDTSKAGSPVVCFDHDTGWHDYGMTLSELLETVVVKALPALGVLPATAVRTAFLPLARPWTPPPAVDVSAARKRALVEGTGLSALRGLVVPPAKPNLGGLSWEWLYGELGTRLPSDYVALMECYGGGEFAGWLRLWTPLDPHGMVDSSEGALDANRQLRAEFPEFHPVPLWPEPGGFLPFGDSNDGDQFGWLTSGEPDEWPLIFAPRHADQGPALAGKLADTVLEWLRGRLVTPGLCRFGKHDDPLEYAKFRSF
ncbi:SMI1/KNR4 family protein [Lentzea sp. NPDC005914]|uniref:SMI1/KNR4 family protein n=1 Tax=Lentzea sp. NPDC005914 TaxID=3154572 RepID=UPI00340322E7